MVLPFKMVLTLLVTGAGGLVVAKEFNKPMNIAFAVGEGETCKNMKEHVEGNEVRIICYSE